ncbi:DUF2799 domain-containing protein [Alcaligenaceae bacterium]|nr:DUF2799 domain-containing protein [Alcaligenaceae bacterium]
MIRTTVFAALILLGGCASMSPEECQTVEWYEQGMRDGQRGYPLARSDSHREACAKVGVGLDLRRYQAGHSMGIREYCTPDVGLREGRLGRGYQNSCPPSLEHGFLQAYQAGYRVYRAQQEVDRLDRELMSKQRELDKAKNDGARSRLRKNLRNLDQRLREARNEVYYAERELR